MEEIKSYKATYSDPFTCGSLANMPQNTDETQLKMLVSCHIVKNYKAIQTICEGKHSTICIIIQNLFRAQELPQFLHYDEGCWPEGRAPSWALQAWRLQWHRHSWECLSECHSCPFCCWPCRALPSVHWWRTNLVRSAYGETKSNVHSFFSLHGSTILSSPNKQPFFLEKLVWLKKKRLNIDKMTERDLLYFCVY